VILRLLQQNMVVIVFGNMTPYRLLEGARGSVVVKALCYKAEGRGFETL
jgi:hypothetical protein